MKVVVVRGALGTMLCGLCGPRNETGDLCKHSYYDTARLWARHAGLMLLLRSEKLKVENW